MTDNTVKLPEPAATIGPCMFGGEPKVAVPVFTADQLTAAVMADRAERSQWTKQKPTNPGVYAVCRYNIGYPEDRAVVEVDVVDGKLRTNLHEINSERFPSRWARLGLHNDKFQWLWLAPLPQPPAEDGE